MDGNGCPQTIHNDLPPLAAPLLPVLSLGLPTASKMNHITAPRIITGASFQPGK